jgi:hypothetical protein
MSGSRGVALTGLDGSNPLAFLAAVGALQVLSRTPPQLGSQVYLSWRDDGTWMPVLHGVASLEQVADAVMADRETWRCDPSLTLAYTKQGQRVGPDDPAACWDVKAPPSVFREYLDELAILAATGPRRPADVAAALGSENGLDNSGFVKPTGFHFTAGQQQFLRMVTGIRDGLERSHVERALNGPWTRDSTLPTLAWDSMSARMYALRAADPSTEKRGGEPGADWLAFMGLLAFSVSARRGKLATPCFEGGWKNATFSWPMWTVPLTRRVVRSLLSSVSAMGAAELRARGVAIVFSSRVIRSDQGGYGNFSPSSPVA